MLLPCYFFFDLAIHLSIKYSKKPLFDAQKNNKGIIKILKEKKASINDILM